VEDGDLVVLDSDGLEQLLLGLLAVEVVASPRVDEQVEDRLLFV
jgi:hypothetical protein